MTAANTTTKGKQFISAQVVQFFARVDTVEEIVAIIQAACSREPSAHDATLE
jgi:hypothetical protein